MSNPYLVAGRRRGPTFPSDDLISYWKLDENALDAKGTNNGTITGATYTSSGKINGAYSFDGSDDIAIAQSDTLDFGTGDFTISFWFKVNNNNANGVMGYGDRGDSAGWTILIEDSGKIAFLIDDGTTQIKSTGTTNWADNDWHLGMVIVDAGATQKLYVDNILQDTDDISAVGSLTTTDHGNITIGKYWNTASYVVNKLIGSLDEIGIWGRALTTDDIALLYNSGSGLTYSNVPVANNDGTMVNMVAGDIIDSPFSDSGTIKALDLDGVNDWVNLQDTSDIRIADNLSVVGFAYFGDHGTEENIITHFGYSDGDYRAWAIQTGFLSDQHLRVMVMGSTGTWDPRRDYETNDNLLTDGWHQVGFTFASGVLKLYVDGVYISSVNKFTDNAVNTLFSGAGEKVVIGSRDTTVPNGFFQGKICNVSMWDTAVLSDADITALYNSGDGLDPEDLTPSGSANLVSSWLWNTSLTYPTIPDNV